MKCPFLKEAEVRSCREGGSRTMIPCVPETAAHDRCSSEAYRECRVYQEHAASAAAPLECPFLDQALMQYCAAAGVRKFVPFNEDGTSRCASGGYRYCQLFVDSEPDPPERRIAGVRVPEGLHHSLNHLWLDAGQDGCCHVGIDGFFARALGGVDRVTFLSAVGVARPAAVLTAQGIDVPVVFPNTLRITARNLCLRADPARLAADCYRAGWLSAGWEGEEPAYSGLLSGPEADEWLHLEAQRIGNGPTRSSRRETLEFFHRFFSPFRVEREP